MRPLRLLCRLLRGVSSSLRLPFWATIREEKTWFRRLF